MRPLYLRANGLKTLTSKNARWPVVHTPLALMSNLASADVFADFGTSVSTEREDSCGSTHTSLQTSYGYAVQYLKEKRGIRASF